MGPHRQAESLAASSSSLAPSSSVVFIRPKSVALGAHMLICACVGNIAGLFVTSLGEFVKMSTWDSPPAPFSPHFTTNPFVVLYLVRGRPSASAGPSMRNLAFHSPRPSPPSAIAAL